jgi:hypothetical protein
MSIEAAVIFITIVFRIAIIKFVGIIEV